MKRIAVLAVLVLFAITLIACAQPESTRELIKPGDKIGDMVVNKTDMQGTDYFIDTYCYTPREIGKNEYEFDCQAKEGDLILIPCGRNAATVEELDAMWEKFTCEMMIDDRIVDLSKFGPVQHPCQRIPGKICRVYGVAIENITAGNHTIINKKIHEGEIESVGYFNFTVTE